MLADTDAIRALGSASSAHAADLAAVASTLSSLPGPALATAFGPVGARFLAALADATAREARAVTALSDSVAAACPTAYATATAYGDADHRVGDSLGF
jgi:prophage DNA circulation protein